MKIFLKNTFDLIKKDSMVLLLLISPLLIALLMKYGSIILNNILFDHYHFDLRVYYLYIDGFIFFMSGMIYGLVIAFLIIDEIDDGVVSYYNITPIGGKKYLQVRFLLPLLFLLILFSIISVFLTLMRYDLLKLISIWVFSISQMYLTGLIVINLANNKLEALVVSKMLGLQIIPFILSIFEKSNFRYFFSFLPSLFLGLAFERNFYFNILLSILISIVMICIFKLRFQKKLYTLT